MDDKSKSPDDIPAQVIRAACEGDQSAFGELYRALYPRIHRLLWGMMGTEPEAHEVAQEAWVKAWNKRRKFNFNSKYSTWIHRIAVNCGLDALRKRKRMRSRFISLFAGSQNNEQDSNVIQYPSDESGPARRMQSTELGQTIESAVQALPDEQRTVLVLREYEGYSYGEIAEALGIKEGTVMSRLYHARKKLQTSLSKELS